MTTNQSIYLAMANRSMAILNNKSSIWTGKLRTKARVDKVQSIIDTISDLFKQQGLRTRGATDDKDNQRLITSNKALHIDNVLKSYYDDIEDTKNMGIIDFSFSDFMYSSMQSSITDMELVYETAAAIVAKTPTAFADYNVGTTEIPDLKVSIDLLKGVVPVSSTMKSGNKTVTAEINVQYDLLRKAFISLDPNIGTFIVVEPEFVKLYNNGRRQVQTSGGHTTATVALMPAHTEAVLGKKYTLGDVMTIKNTSLFPAQYGFTDNPDVLPTVMKELAGSGEVKETIVADAKGSFGHWLVVHNASAFDDVNVSVSVAKGN